MTCLADTFEGHDALLAFTVEVAGPVLRVAFRGELDMSCAALFDTLFDLPTEGIDTVLLDLGELAFCDVSGANALSGLRAFHQFSERSVQHVNVLPHVLRLMAITDGPVPSLREGGAPA